MADSLPHRPTEAELLAFLQGRADATLTHQISAWLEQDEDSARQLERLAGLEEFAWQQLRDPRSEWVHVSQSLIEKLKSGDFVPLETEERAWELLDVRPEGDSPGLLGGFEITTMLACGGMGIVFEGRDTALQRKVAIKVPLAYLAGNERAAAAFWQEAQAVAALDHPNIVPVYSVHRREDLVYFVMPLISGQTLSELVKKNGPLSPRQTMQMGLQITQALKEAHQHGIIHRDIKPGNILVEEERVRVVDFGIAAVGLTAGSSAGTPGYMAPEQANAQIVTDAADIYGLGATLHFCLTGREPEGAVLRSKGWIGQLIGKMCHVQPAQRPTAGELEALLAKKLRRRRRSVFLAMMAGAAAVVVLTVSLTPLGITGWVNRAIAKISGRKFHIEGMAGTHESLLDAAKKAAGRTIFADFDGELGLGVTDFGSFPVRIEAAAGRKPIFRQDQPAQRLFVSKAPLHFHGVTLMRPAAAAPEQRSLAQTINATLTLTNCRLLSAGTPGSLNGELLRMTGQGALALTDCVIDAPGANWLVLRRFRDQPELETMSVVVKNCQITSGPVLMEPSPGLKIDAVLTGCTFDQSVGFALHRRGDAQLRVTSENCRFAYSDCLIWLNEAPANWENAFLWKGKENIHAKTVPTGSFIRIGSGTTTQRLAQDEKQWLEMPNVE